MKNNAAYATVTIEEIGVMIKGKTMLPNLFCFGFFVFCFFLQAECFGNVILLGRDLRRGKYPNSSDDD